MCVGGVFHFVCMRVSHMCAWFGCVLLHAFLDVHACGGPGLMPGLILYYICILLIKTVRVNEMLNLIIQYATFDCQLALVNPCLCL